MSIRKTEAEPFFPLAEPFFPTIDGPDLAVWQTGPDLTYSPLSPRPPFPGPEPAAFTVQCEKLLSSGGEAANLSPVNDARRASYV